jgi:hypothetical protein
MLQRCSIGIPMLQRYSVTTAKPSATAFQQPSQRYSVTTASHSATAPELDHYGISNATALQRYNNQTQRYGVTTAFPALQRYSIKHCPGRWFGDKGP